MWYENLYDRTSLLLSVCLVGIGSKSNSNNRMPACLSLRFHGYSAERILMKFDEEGSLVKT